MADKTTSMPLFGDPSVEEINAIKKHMEAFTARLVKTPKKARELLRETGAVAGAADGEASV